jgi:hypothetical protein
VHARGVDENDLPRRPLALAFDIHDALDPITRGLRLASYDGQFLADQRIQQRGLACVGTADDGNESGTKWHDRLLSVSPAEADSKNQAVAIRT